MDRYEGEDLYDYGDDLTKMLTGEGGLTDFIRQGHDRTDEAYGKLLDDASREIDAWSPTGSEALAHRARMSNDAFARAANSVRMAGGGLPGTSQAARNAAQQRAMLEAAKGATVADAAGAEAALAVRDRARLRQQGLLGDRSAAWDRTASRLSGVLGQWGGAMADIARGRHAGRMGLLGAWQQWSNLATRWAEGDAGRRLQGQILHRGWEREDIGDEAALLGFQSGYGR